ncbi:reverse transcriptase domain-containing protein [Rhodococcoides yunnanense]|uniref:reverse transcriptase domain-containing protein n=1 Tax=Rhodococcoides yunnanense TaxID=278209 RepID=UPI000A012E4F|nr:reverse transcriptase domain-containing protein [Rhodococcus yunnanensis]
MSAAALKSLNIKVAFQEEALATRNLLPSEPLWDVVGENSLDLTRYLSNLLRAGFQPTPEIEVSVRKPAHGSRPVPFWGMLERVAYRAITSAVLSNESVLDRSVEAYLKFVTAPVLYALNNPEPQKRRRRGRTGSISAQQLFVRSEVKYVVKSDITAFYQFIDHAVLAKELLLRGSDFELIEALTSLLEEVQGRKYGLPQLLDSSDRLSDVYADIIERELLRSGLAVWRFNDDFRIASRSYESAINAIESLDASVRRAGLVIAEHKTVTVGLLRYLVDNLGQSALKDGVTISTDDFEALVGDYADEFGEGDADAALSIIRGAQALPWEGQESGAESGSADVAKAVDESRSGESESTESRPSIDLRNLRSDDIRLLRRALNGLAANVDSRAIPDVIRFAAFVPALMPNLMRYLSKVADVASGQVVDTVGNLVGGLSLNAWQRIWLVDTMRELQAVDVDRASAWQGWLFEQRMQIASPPLRAYATRALAAGGHIDLSEIIDESDQSPQALLHIYIAAAVDYCNQLRTEERAGAEGLIKAWAKSSVLHQKMLQGAVQ